MITYIKQIIIDSVFNYARRESLQSIAKVKATKGLDLESQQQAY